MLGESMGWRMARMVCFLAAALLSEAFGQPDAGRALQGTRSDELPSVDDVFQRRDANRDGRLSQDEIPESARERMLRADADRDGSVARNELDEARARRGQGPATNRPGSNRPSPGLVAATVAVTADGLDAFLDRREVGRGTNVWHGVRLCWRAADDGVAPGAEVDVRVFAIAMVYVPAEDFFVGDGLSPGRFHAGGDPSQAYRVTRQPIEFKNSPSGLWADHTRTPLPAGTPGPDLRAGSLGRSHGNPSRQGHSRGARRELLRRA